MPVRAYYEASVSTFLTDDPERILGVLAAKHQHDLEQSQRWAWLKQIAILKQALVNRRSDRLFLEFSIPRMGKRADAILVARSIIFVLEFKIGAGEYGRSAFEQVEDYALDLKNFHEGSHTVPIVPVLIATNAPSQALPELHFAADDVATPVATNETNLGFLLEAVCATYTFADLDVSAWETKGYRPTPTIIEAAEVLYRDHSVADISRSDAGAKNLHETSVAVSSVIDDARQKRRKAICFVTGVPGSGKTLAGLNIATYRSDYHPEDHAVFLSGNGPLVDVLRQALTRDKARRDSVSKKTAERQVRSFIQNIHHFRDHYVSKKEIPTEKVSIFDEAQRAWTRKQASSFMQRKKGHAGFDMSEPEFLLSVMDRHRDWCTVVYLVGGGQEINTGEAGISEWISALESRFPHWDVHVSPRICLPEYGSQLGAQQFLQSARVYADEHLHLSVSMRSFRAEALSDLVGHVLDNDPEAASKAYKSIAAAYPIVLTRDLEAARAWLRHRARGTERFGLVASSRAQRLRPEGIHIKAAIEPTYWFLNHSSDVRSSSHLEEVASEFDVQGLELDWAGVCWDGDLHYRGGQWISQSFKGTTWRSVNDSARRLYHRNAYRVILTRARQGMVLFVPQGDRSDCTRPPSFYDGTFNFLRSCGFPQLGNGDETYTSDAGSAP